MKRNFIAVLMLLSTAAPITSFGNPPVPSILPVYGPVLLERETQGKPPYGSLRSTSTVRVFTAGAVYADLCQPLDLQTYPPQARQSCRQGIVRFLDASEVSEIQNLIEEARQGNFVGPKPGQAQCQIVPNQAITYRVGHNSSDFLLFTGYVPCSEVYHNDSEAASKLVQKLDGLAQEFTAQNSR